MCKCEDVQICKLEDVQMREYADVQIALKLLICKFTHLHICTSKTSAHSRICTFAYQLMVAMAFFSVSSSLFNAW